MRNDFWARTLVLVLGEIMTGANANPMTTKGKKKDEGRPSGLKTRRNADLEIFQTVGQSGTQTKSHTITHRECTKKRKEEELGLFFEGLYLFLTIQY